MGDMYKLQKEAKNIKKELAQTHVFAESNGIKVTVNGEQEVLSVEILDESILGDAKALSKNMADATNRALKKAQSIAAERMKSVMGMMGGAMGGGQ